MLDVRRATLLGALTLVSVVAPVGFGCSAGYVDHAGASPGGDPPGPPAPDIRTPPPGAPPSQTGCGSVTAAGHCEDQSAVFCDTTANLVRRLDCAAAGQTCTTDGARGAGCSEPPKPQTPGTPPDPPPAPPPPPSDPCAGLDYYGTCAGTIVRWCEGGKPQAVDCGPSGLTCATEVCFDGGAACCTAAQVQTTCETLGVYGECGGVDDQTVRWCDSGGKIHDTLDCKLLGKTCKLDVCGFGAQCCD